jgi:hypothetical protein
VPRRGSSLTLGKEEEDVLARIKVSWHGDKEPKVEPVRFSIQGQEFDRVRYGEGADDLDHPKCDDCGVLRRKLHLLGCDLEPCPRCTGQAISCDCFYDDD